MVMDAVQREKNIKHWSTPVEDRLIENSDPDWNDLMINWLEEDARIKSGHEENYRTLLGQPLQPAA